MENSYLIWLDWPIDAFRINERSEAEFKRIVSKYVKQVESQVVVVRSEKAFLDALPYATHVVCWDFKKEWLPKAVLMKLLATPAAGRELVPTYEEMPCGVKKFHGAFHGPVMSETVIAFMFAYARGLYAAYDFQREGVLWARGEMSRYCRMVEGSKAVILGYGRIGKIIGAKLSALGVDVAGFGRKNIAMLREELQGADWLIVALPSDTGTDDIVDAAVLACLPRSAVVINIGRGNAIDEAALATALEKREIEAAFLDVFKNEPLTGSSPLAEDLPGLYRMPHASAFTEEYLPMFFREVDSHGLWA